MAKKMTIVTKETLDEPEMAPQTEIEPEPERGETELQSFFDSMAGNEVVVKIYKIINGQQAYCGSAEPAVVTEDAILQKWGGGRYVLRAVKQGRFIAGGNRTITLFEPVESALKPAGNPVPLPAGSLGEVGLLREELGRQHEMLMRMIDQKGGGGTALADMTGMLGFLQSMIPKQPDIMSVLPNVMDLFKSSMEMAKEAAGATTGGTDWGKLATDALGKLPAIVAALSAGKSTGVQPGAVLNQAVEMEGGTVEADTFLTGALTRLKQQAMKGMPVELVADWIAGNTDDSSYRNLTLAILNRPFEDVLKADPEIGREPLRAWFANLFRLLRESFHESETTGATAGPDGGDTGATGNEAPDD